MKTPSLLILMLTLFLLATGEVGSAYQESKDDLVTRQYLHYADTTLIYSDLGRPALSSAPRSQQLMVQIRVQYKGEKRIKPELVEILLFSHPRWSPNDEHKPRLLIFAGGTTLDAAGPEKSTAYSVSLNHESFHFTLPREQFLRMAGARTVRMQLDGVDLDLTDDQRKRLRAFAKEIR